MELREVKVRYSEEKLQNRTSSGLFQTVCIVLYDCKGGAMQLQSLLVSVGCVRLYEDTKPPGL